MNENIIPINKCLSGENAFFNHPNYSEITKEEMASTKPLESPTYIYNTESKLWRTTKNIFSVIIFPIGLYRIIHLIAGRIIIPASSFAVLGIDSNYINSYREKIDFNNRWKVKRISIQVDGHTIDAAIIGRTSTLGNGRWILSSNGNAEFYEIKLQNQSFHHILSKFDSNGIVFNYPGVGASSGMPHRNTMAKAYRALLTFLEDQKDGIGAKEIIGYGHSIGAAVQADALLSHQLKDHVKYVFIKSRTFCDLSRVASILTNRYLGSLIDVFGWNMDPFNSSKKLKAPEIILQTANVSTYMDISKQPEKIIDDGIISAHASLAKKLLEDEEYSKENKYFIGIPEKHNAALRDPSFLIQKVHEISQIKKMSFFNEFFKIFIPN